MRRLAEVDIEILVDEAAALFDQVVVDKARLTRHIRHALQDRAQITLSELVTRQPLQQGLAELVRRIGILRGERVAVPVYVRPEQ